VIRRFIFAALAAAFVVPIHVTPPASGAILFTCPGIDSGSWASLLPGLAHTQTAQDATGYIPVSTPCSNGEVALFRFGSGFGFNPVTSYPPRPLGCPVAWGGTGPDYADQTPILLGATDPNLTIFWDSSTSQGVAKAKAGASGTQYRLVLIITSGAYAPPPGQKTKIKAAVDIAPYPGTSYTCADDSDPLEMVELSSAGAVIVQQK
jgi:hypothetical protein